MPQGLESLIPKKIKKDISRKKESIFWIETKKIKPNPFQPRKEFSKKDLQDLANSIEKYGILQPLIVKKIEKEVTNGAKVEYQLIAGERRLRAAEIIGMREVPVIIEEVKKEDELPISLVENLQRENLNPIEKAMAFKKLIKEFDFTQKEIARLFGKSREVISNTLRLLDLPEEIKRGIKKGEISEGHARALLAVKENERMKVFKEIIEKKLPVREIEKKAEIRAGKERKENKRISKMQIEISKTLGIKDVKVKIVNNKTEIILIFKIKKDLENFLKKINCPRFTAR